MKKECSVQSPNKKIENSRDRVKEKCAPNSETLPLGKKKSHKNYKCGDSQVARFKRGFILFIIFMKEEIIMSVILI